MSIVKRSWFLLILIVGTFVLVGCNAIEKEQTDLPFEERPAAIEQLEANPALIRANVIVVAAPNIKGNFNPMLIHSGTEKWVMDAVFEGLLTYDANGRRVPELAEKMEIDETGAIFTFTIKTDVKFHDDTFLTTEDVIFTYKTLFEKGSQDYYSTFASAVESFERIDEQTVQFKFFEADIGNIDFFVKGILPQHHYESFYNDKSTFSVPLPIGTGPVTFESFTPLDNITLNQFGGYHGNISNVKRIVLKLMNSEAAVKAFLEGQVDMASVEPNEANFIALSGVSFGKSQYFSSPVMATIGINHLDPVLADINIRQALAYGLNREAYIKKQWFKESSPTYGPLLENHFLYPNDQAFDDYSYDLEKASQLLDASGWLLSDLTGFREKDNQTLKLSIMAYSDVAWSYNLAIHAQDAWKALGIQVDIEWMDFEALVKKVYTDREGMLWTMAWEIPAHLDPRKIYNASSAGNYKNEVLNGIFESLARAKEEPEKLKLTAEWLRIVNKEIPMLYIANIGELWAVNQRVVGLNLNPYVSWVKLLNNVTLESLE